MERSSPQAPYIAHELENYFRKCILSVIFIDHLKVTHFSGASLVAQCVWTAGQCKKTPEMRFYPHRREDSLRGKWRPAPVFLPKNSIDRGALVGYSGSGRKELNMVVTQHTHTVWGVLLWQSSEVPSVGQWGIFPGPLTILEYW